MDTSGGSSEVEAATSNDIREFRHTPLDQDKQQIRLIKFLNKMDTGTAESSAMIAFEIEHFDLADVGPDKAVQYTALSYEWGPEQPRCKISVDGLDFYIRSNLHDCLLELRHHVTGYLWVDQLCIDQKLVTERNHQVQLMASIFSQAETVYAWLGKADHDSDKAMFLLDKLETTACSSHSPEDSSRRIEYYFSELKREVAGTQMGALKSLFDRQYWTRLWIVQEVYLAKILVLMCGSHVSRIYSDIKGHRYNAYFLNNLVDRLEIAGRSPEWFPSDGPATGLLHFVTRSTFPPLEDSNFAERYELHVALELTVKRKCQDARDHIYGIQACFEPSWQIPVDYRLSQDAVYRVFLKHLRRKRVFNGTRYQRDLVREVLPDIMGVSRTRRMRLEQRIIEIPGMINDLLLRM